MTENAPDLDAIENAYLRPCGACDGGLPTSCTCGPDPRNAIAALIARVRELEAAQTWEYALFVGPFRIGLPRAWAWSADQIADLQRDRLNTIRQLRRWKVEPGPWEPVLETNQEQP